MNTLLKRLIPAGIAAVSLIGCGICAGISSGLTGSQFHQQAAERWQQNGGELPYAQVSMFCASSASVYTASIEGFRESINAALTKASLEAERKDTRLWYDCYTIQRGTATVQGKKTQTAEALVTAIGGDFFMMHPMPLADGSYISPADLMHDRVVIDELLAWQVFGSDAVAGMELTVDGTVYQIAGVVKLASDRSLKTAYGETARLYMLYDTSSQDSGTMEDMYSYSDTQDTVTCYEAVLPNPVRGFAEKTLTEAAGERDGMQIKVNTRRGSLKNRWETLQHLREMVTADTGILYPFWENAARMNDFTAAQLLGWEIAFLVFPVLYLLWMLWKGYRALERFITENREKQKRRYRTIEKDPFSI